MSYTYLLASGEVSSAENFSDIPAFVLSRLNLTADKFCSNGSATEFCRASQFGTTFEHSTGGRGAELSTASAAASPAQTSLLADDEQGLTVKKAAFGVKWHELFARFDHTTFSWKTQQTLLFQDSTESLETLPQWGIMRLGELWEGSVSGEPIEKGVGLWGSPTATAWRDLTFTQAQCLKSTFGAQQRRYTTQFLRLTGDFPGVLFAEWIMDFPIGWTDLEPQEWHKFRSWLLPRSTIFQEP